MIGFGQWGPRRIIMDNGSPGMFGAEWGELRHTYVIQLVHAPKSAPYQNGLVGRSAMSLKAGTRPIMAQEGTRPPQKPPPKQS